MQLVKEMIIRLVPCFKKYRKMIAIDLSKQYALDANPKGIKQIKFTLNVNQKVAMFFIIEEARNYCKFFTRNREIAVSLI